ncbi:hypothetical protein Gotri_002340 [Gossypium trilobum]|uniref:Uncharacterized protein n=1 Tax=Gossypium trilobum TaxID=34281 RepID=A0A7J9F7Y4_9ROSI|nr:hypothetical protein [Gossypium trilobum]
MVSCSRTGERVTLDGRDSMAANPIMVKDDRTEEDGKEAVSEELPEVNNKGIRVMNGVRVSGGDQGASVKSGMAQLRVNQEASTSVISGKVIGEPSDAPGVRSFASISSNISTHLNPIIEGLMKVAVSLRECVFDPSKHTTVVFKENVPLNLV